ncbi:unnamed protein product [Caenorhabditis auriculariae]|uniref:Uncharacterized protein n=1 Tax=Caenorhabditis auriculariae TaxID=2777116 RepID=A0A8S1GU13_9PELO|nr:unnamed protein product [Caenorhabditis auriculariae]
MGRRIASRIALTRLVTAGGRRFSLECSRCALSLRLRSHSLAFALTLAGLPSSRLRPLRCSPFLLSNFSSKSELILYLPHGVLLTTPLPQFP